MIRLVVFAIIAAVAGVMLWYAWQGECPGGTVVFSQNDCRAKLSARDCAEVYARADVVARSAGTVFQDPVECSRQFGPCLEHAAVVGGWTPRPAGFCVASFVWGREGAGQLRNLSIQPVYRADGGRSQQ